MLRGLHGLGEDVCGSGLGAADDMGVNAQDDGRVDMAEAGRDDMR